MSRLSVRSHSKRQKPERGHSERRTKGEKADSSELRNADLSLSAANTLRLQTLIGNRNVQRLMSSTASSQASNPSLQMSPPAATEAAESPADVSDVMVIEEGMYIGNAEFHAKAAPLNQKYAARFAERGWPYTDELKALWDNGDVNEFADRVAGFQYFTLKLAENNVDGVLGPITSSGLLKHHGQPNVTSDAAPGTVSDVTPVANAPAPAPTVADNADDATYRDHPAVVRILTPVQQAFNIYLNVIKAKKKSDNKEEQNNPNTAEMANSREVLGNAIKEARSAVQALTAADFAGSQQDFNGARGYIYRTLSANSVHYAQGDNANVLYKIEDGKKHNASSRTCNMTVMAMMLATLGKTADDYKGGLASLLPIAKEQEGNLGFSVSTEDALRSLRLPDFMQLVAIKVAGSHAEAAKKITHHSFIISIAREFGLTPVEMNAKGEFVSRDKPDKSAPGDGLEDSFLSHAYTHKLNMMGLLYRPSERDAMKALKKDDGYKALGKDKDKQKDYAEKYVADYVDKQRLGLIANYDTWIALDTVVKDQVVGLQSAVDSAESFDAVQPKVDEVIQALKTHKDGLPKNKYSNMKKRIDTIVKGLNEAQAKKAKPEKALKNLKALFAGKKSPARQMEKAITDYEDNKKLYETLGEPEGAEQVLSIANYQNTILAELQAALSAGNQVMVNLENHFVRLQALDETAVYIDDPANREETQTKITWEHARKYGYFQRYLLLAP